MSQLAISTQSCQEVSTSVLSFSICGNRQTPQRSLRIWCRVVSKDRHRQGSAPWIFPGDLKNGLKKKRWELSRFGKQCLWIRRIFRFSCLTPLHHIYITSTLSLPRPHGRLAADLSEHRFTCKQKCRGGKI